MNSKINELAIRFRVAFVLAILPVWCLPLHSQNQAKQTQPAVTAAPQPLLSPGQQPTSNAATPVAANSIPLSTGTQVAPAAGQPGAEVDNSKDYISLSMTAVMGPLGYVPENGKGGSWSITTNTAGSIFPSIYFFISASPLNLDLIDKQAFGSGSNGGPVRLDDKKYQELFADRTLDWMSVHIELDPQIDPKLASTDQSVKGSPCKGLQILEILPNSTVSEPHIGISQAAANTVAEVVTSFAPAVAPNGALTQGAGQGLAVLFDNLMRPKSVAYQYAEMENSCHFGWYFKGDEHQVSLLGLQSGVVLLRAPASVSSIKVTGYIVSKWSGAAPTADRAAGRKLLAQVQSVDLPLPPESELGQVDLEHLQDLTPLPMIIPIKAVATFLHANPDDVKQLGISEEDKTGNCVTPGKSLTFTPGCGYVTKGSLQKYLGMESGSGATTGSPTADGGQQNATKGPK